MIIAIGCRQYIGKQECHRFLLEAIAWAMAECRCRFDVEFATFADFMLNHLTSVSDAMFHF